ncbi:MAG: type II secretion system GspH family protein [Candidatus Omnitrophica bacterium]|nr:type II secretion system GspH family protein [Candidatus Omnitrophota bacterium]
MKTKGFTLIEMVISIAVLAIIAVVLTPIVLQSIDLFLMSRTQEVLANESRFAMNWMSEEIKTECASFNTIDGMSLTFTTCATCDPPNTPISYDWDSANNRLIRTVGGGDDNDDILAERVSFAEFRVFDTVDLDMSAGQTNVSDFSTFDVRFVQIRLAITDDTGTKAYSLVTRIMPRYLQ